MHYGNLAKWIQAKLTTDETIEGVLIGNSPRSHNIPNYEQQPRDKVISWEEAKKWLDYDFVDGFCTADCNEIYVWTNLNVFFLHVDSESGSVWLDSVPRNPQNTFSV